MDAIAAGSSPCTPVNNPTRAHADFYAWLSTLKIDAFRIVISISVIVMGLAFTTEVTRLISSVWLEGRLVIAQ